MSDAKDDRGVEIYAQEKSSPSEKPVDVKVNQEKIIPHFDPESPYKYFTQSWKFLFNRNNRKHLRVVTATHYSSISTGSTSSNSTVQRDSQKRKFPENVDSFMNFINSLPVNREHMVVAKKPKYSSGAVSKPVLISSFEADEELEDDK